MGSLLTPSFFSRASCSKTYGQKVMYSLYVSFKNHLLWARVYHQKIHSENQSYTALLFCSDEIRSVILEKGDTGIIGVKQENLTIAKSLESGQCSSHAMSFKNLLVGCQEITGGDQFQSHSLIFILIALLL